MVERGAERLDLGAADLAKLERDWVCVMRWAETGASIRLRGMGRSGAEASEEVETPADAPADAACGEDDGGPEEADDGPCGILMRLVPRTRCTRTGLGGTKRAALVELIERVVNCCLVMDREAANMMMKMWRR